MVNTNKLIRNYKGITGLKTGSTSLALFNLSATATRDDLSLIAVIMKGPSSVIRFNEAKKLLDYGFSNFTYKKLADKGTTIKNVIVEKGVEKFAEAILDGETGVLIKTGQDKNVVQQMNVPDTISAPIQKGQIIGEVIYKLNDEEIARVNVICNKDIKKVGFINNSAHLFEKWFNLCR